MTNTYWDEYEQASKEESGGGGIVCRAKILTGYKTYVTGMTQPDTFSAAPAGDRAARDKAKEEIALLGRPNWGIMIIAQRDGALSAGKAATWQGDRYLWRDDWREKQKPGDDVVLSSLKNVGIPGLPFEGYVRIGFQDNPFAVRQGEDGKKANSQTGEMEFPTIAYVTAVLNEAEYQAALAEADSSDAQGDVLAAFDGDSGLEMPDVFGNDRGLWESTVKEIAEKIGGGPDAVRLVKITNALTEGHETYLGYSAAGIETTPQQILDWANSLGV